MRLARRPTIACAKRQCGLQAVEYDLVHHVGQVSLGLFSGSDGLESGTLQLYHVAGTCRMAFVRCNGSLVR